MVNIPVVQQISSNSTGAVLGQGGDMPVVATTGAVLVVVWEVVDMPVYVQRQVPCFQPNFHIFYVNVDSDPEAEFDLKI